MWQNAIRRFMALLMMILLASPVFLLPGCGNNDAASDGATIVINPSSSTATISADTTFNYTVTVRYSDGKPYPKAIVHISGPFAAPRNVAGSNPRYQFYYGPGGLLGTNPLPVNSGFDAQTDDYGNYQFSIVVPGLVGGAKNTFTDTIDVSSGSALGTIALSIS
jgi:hypothetical protein